MSLFRLATIIFTGLRFGLDEILVRSFAPPGLARAWLLVMFWRPLFRPRAVRLRAALEYLGPLFVKFGQVLSTRRDILPADIAAELVKLQDSVEPQPFAQLHKVLKASFGDRLETDFQEFDETPLGSASVAQVHRATLADGRTVAVKILRPGIRQQVANDIGLMRTCAWIVERLFHDGRRLHPRELVEEFHRCLLEETDLLHEAGSCNQLRRNFADQPQLRSPEVFWEHCTADVMVMELLEGVPIDQVDELQAAGVDLEKLARTGINIFFTQVFRDSFFHADMHPGNLLVDAEGRIVLLDYGIMGSLSDFDKEYIGANFLAFFNRDYRRVAQMHVEAGWTPPDTPIPQFEAAIRAVCEPVFARPLHEISFGRLLLQLFQVARRFNLEVQPQLILLQKTLLNIEGIGRQLAPQLNLWDTAKPFLEDWARQQRSPQRIAQLVKEGLPSVLALLPELPMAARLALQRSRRASREQQEIDSLQRGIRRWQLAAAAAAALAIWLLL